MTANQKAGFLRDSQSPLIILTGDGVQLWSERGDLLLTLGEQGPGAAATSVTLSMDGRYIIRSGDAILNSLNHFEIYFSKELTGCDASYKYLMSIGANKKKY